MLLCVTANHRSAPFELLDRLVTLADGTAEQLVGAATGIRGAVVLATCNRFEAYLDVAETASGSAADATVAAIERAGDIDAGELREGLRVLTDRAVPEHLFAVSAGLESLAVGEDEIAGQVSRALEHARADGTASSELEHLFQHATRTSRHVRSATALGGAGRSLVRLALELASSRVPDWAEARVLVVGTGNYAATTISALHDVGVADIRVFSRTGRAARFGAKYGVRSESELRPAIADADVVITCTSTYAVGVEDVAPGARLLIIDLGLPRNVDPDVRQLPDVELLDLEVIGLHAPLGLTAETDARRLVSDAADAYAAARAAAPGIVAMRRHVDGIVEAEISRLRGAGSDERTIEALRHLAGVLLHEPSVRARELAAAGRSAEFEDAVSTLFGAEVEHAEAAQPTGSRIRSA